MNEKLYNVMNWPIIEAIEYSEYDAPYDILGPHKISEGILIQTYQPTAKHVCVIRMEDNSMVDMEAVGEKGYFSVLLPMKKNPSV